MVNSNQYTIQGSGKPLVFQHGLGANRFQITSLLNTLENTRLLTMDAPGHGHFPYDPGCSPSFDWFTDEVIRVMDINGIYQAVIGGLSMGSGIAINMALRYPGRVAALILLRPAWFCSPVPDNLKILLKVADCLEMTDGDKIFKEDALFQKMQADLPAAAASVMGMFDRDQQQFTSRLLRAMVKDQPCPHEKIPAIELPTLVIGNDEDPLHPWEMADMWHHAVPESILVKAPSRYAEPDAHQSKVVSAISEFLNEIPINHQ